MLSVDAEKVCEEKQSAVTVTVAVVSNFGRLTG